jgi:hypothetical protein
MTSNTKQPGDLTPRDPIVQRDDGLWAIGIADDAPGPFASRAHAESVASQSAARAAPPLF